MNKLLSFILLLIISIALAGVYGILHDQITYSISPEYYIKFKFIQFGLASQEPEMVASAPRLCAAFVGFMATWWFGLFMGAMLAITALRIPPSQYFGSVIKAIFIVIGVAVITAVIGFICGKYYDHYIPGFWQPPGSLLDEKGYIIVGTIHNFSYAGGAIGTLVGMTYLFIKRRLVQP